MQIFDCTRGWFPNLCIVQGSTLVSFSDLGLKIMLASQNELGSIPSSLIFRKNLRKTDNCSLNIWWNSQVKPYSPGIFFVERFLKNYSFNLLTTYRSV